MVNRTNPELELFDDTTDNTDNTPKRTVLSVLS